MTSWFCKKVETLVFHNLGQLFGLCDCALCFFGEGRYAIEPRPNVSSITRISQPCCESDDWSSCRSMCFPSLNRDRASLRIPP